MRRSLLIIMLLVLGASAVVAQSVVTQDDVDEIASRMFCPVCENEPLDQCYNPTCIQWKSEIRDLLAEGYSPNEIITSFVNRYGQHVVGVPQDPMLRILSFSAPILGTLLALVIGWMTFQRWSAARKPDETGSTQNVPTESDPYRSQIERDLM